MPLYQTQYEVGNWMQSSISRFIRLLRFRANSPALPAPPPGFWAGVSLCVCTGPHLSPPTVQVFVARTEWVLELSCGLSLTWAGQGALISGSEGLSFWKCPQERGVPVRCSEHYPGIGPTKDGQTHLASWSWKKESVYFRWLMSSSFHRHASRTQ